MQPTAPSWMARAACLGKATAEHDPWHPPVDAPPSVRRAVAAEAIAICVTCPVQVTCGRLGIERLADEDVIAVYGGMDPDTLRGIARRMGRPTRKTARHGTRAKYVAGCRCALCRAANARGEAARRLAKHDPRRACSALAGDGRPCGHRAEVGSIFCTGHALPDDPPESGLAVA